MKLTLHILTGHGGNDVGNNGGNDGGNKLTERQRLVLGLIKEDSRISANEIVKRLSVTGDAAKRTIERELAALKKAGILLREGSPRYGKWIINDSLIY